MLFGAEKPMRDEDKTKKQLINELVELRESVARLETECKQATEILQKSKIRQDTIQERAKLGTWEINFVNNWKKS